MALDNLSFTKNKIFLLFFVYLFFVTNFIFLLR